MWKSWNYITRNSKGTRWIYFHTPICDTNYVLYILKHPSVTLWLATFFHSSFQYWEIYADICSYKKLLYYFSRYKTLFKRKKTSKARCFKIPDNVLLYLINKCQLRHEYCIMRCLYCIFSNKSLQRQRTSYSCLKIDM